MCNVGIGQHTGQNQGRRGQGRSGPGRAKDRRGQLRRVVGSTDGVGFGKVPQSHGECRVQHTNDTDQRKGGQGIQVLQETERDEDQ